MKKKLISLSFIVLIVFAQSTFAFGTNENKYQYDNTAHVENHIIPLWTNTSTAYSSLESNGNIITAYANIRPKNNTMHVTGAMYLQQYNSGRWVNKAKWPFNKNSNVFLSTTYFAYSGGKYRVKIEATVNKEVISLISNEKYVKL